VQKSSLTSSVYNDASWEWLTFWSTLCAGRVNRWSWNAMLSASEMTYIVSGGALNPTHSPPGTQCKITWVLMKEANTTDRLRLRVFFFSNYANYSSLIPERIEIRPTSDGQCAQTILWRKEHHTKSNVCKVTRKCCKKWRCIFGIQQVTVCNKSTGLCLRGYRRRSVKGYKTTRYN